MATCEYPVLLAMAENPRIFKGDAGSLVINIIDLNGNAVDLTDYDTYILKLVNYPEKDEIITLACEASTVEGRCCSDFTVVQSAAWLASPYQAYVKLTRYVRDQEIIDASTGYVPVTRDLALEAVTTSFQVGETVTGADSGFTGLVRSTTPHADNHQLLTLCLVSGEFIDGEEVTGDMGGEGKVNGTLGVEESIPMVFADDIEDLSVLRVGDILTLTTGDFVVTGFDGLVPAWITLEEDIGLEGEDIVYLALTYDEVDSAVEKAGSSQPFAMQILEIL